MCGTTEIDGYAFCLGVDLLKGFYVAQADLQSLIRSVTYLIKGAIFRSKSRASQDICSLGELIDMYHTHEATKPHDKVYALLGMSSDGASKTDLLPNYMVPWEELFQRLTKFLLCEETSVDIWRDKKIAAEIAVIKSKGCVLGKVSSVRSDITWNGGQGVEIIFDNILKQPEYNGKGSTYWTLHSSEKPIQPGDLICLLQGASKPTVIRLCKDYFAIIMIAATPLENTQTESRYIKWQKLLQLVKVFTRDFLLVWDWKNPPKRLQDLGKYKTLMQSNDWVSIHATTEPEGYLDNATRSWNVALILEDLEEHKTARQMLKEATDGYKKVVGEDYPYTPESRYSQAPLSWAAGNGCNTIVTLLLTKHNVDPDLKESHSGLTALSRAAMGGHEAVVKLLLETGKVEVNAKDSNNQTPLSWAAKGGYKAIVKLLLETGKFEVDSKDLNNQTPLLRAAGRGHEAVVKLLERRA